MMRIIKGVTLVTFIMLFLLTGTMLRIVFRNEGLWRKINFWSCQIYSRIALWILGIDLRTIYSAEADRSSKPKLYICNHMSYTDIMVISAWLHTCYVTSVEIRDTFFLGHMCRIAGCIFIERRSRSNIDGEISEIARTLRAGSNVLIFPEGTSTNGDGVLPFKRSLLKAAISAEVDVQPLCLQYLKGDGTPLTITERDNVCWYGDAGFVPHLWRLLGMRKIRANVLVLPSLSYTPELTRDQIADFSYQSISNAYAPAQPIADSGVTNLRLAALTNVTVSPNPNFTSPC